MRMALGGAETCSELVWVMIFTYLLTPWSRVLHEKLAGFQPVKKFPAFYGTRGLFTAFTSAHHMPLSLASSIQTIPPHSTSSISILILSSHLRLGLPNGLFASGFRVIIFTYNKSVVVDFMFN